METGEVIETLIDTPDIIVKRNSCAGKHRLSLLNHIWVEPGDKSDWEALAELHYKGHTLAAGSRFMRCVYDDGGERQTIGVMVFANPMPNNSGRNRVMAHMRPNRDGLDKRSTNTIRLAFMNGKLTWNNRTVLDTMFRGAGIAYRFKNLSYRLYCTKRGYRFVESNSSMGRFNPFSIKSGMRFIDPRPANALKAGVEFFRANFKSDPRDQVAIIEELESLPERVRAVVERRLREFYFRHSPMEKSGDKMHLGMSRINALEISYVLKQTLQLVFGATVYWFFENPDYGRDLPERLPLLAFDDQGVNEPLNLEARKERV